MTRTNRRSILKGAASVGVASLPAIQVNTGTAVSDPDAELIRLCAEYHRADEADTAAANESCRQCDIVPVPATPAILNEPICPPGRPIIMPKDRAFPNRADIWTAKNLRGLIKYEMRWDCTNESDAFIQDALQRIPIAEAHEAAIERYRATILAIETTVAGPARQAWREVRDAVRATPARTLAGIKAKIAALVQWHLDETAGDPDCPDALPEDVAAILTEIQKLT